MYPIFFDFDMFNSPLAEAEEPLGSFKIGPPLHSHFLQGFTWGKHAKSCESSCMMIVT
jgi:hypothetical protein